VARRLYKLPKILNAMRTQRITTPLEGRFGSGRPPARMLSSIGWNNPDPTGQALPGYPSGFPHIGRGKLPTQLETCLFTYASWVEPVLVTT